MKTIIILCICRAICTLARNSDYLGSGITVELETEVLDFNPKHFPYDNSSVCNDVSCEENETCEAYSYENNVYPLCYNAGSFYATLCHANNFCVNDGDCINGACECPPNTHGLACEVSYAGCENNPCHEDERCISLPNGDTRCQSKHLSFTLDHLIRVEETSAAVTTSPPEDACTEHSCIGDNCTCVPSCMHELGFYCISSIGYIGRNCNIGPPILKCEASAIEVQILSAFLEEFDFGNNDSVAYVSDSKEGLFNPLCAAVDQGDWFVVTIPAPFTQCGGTPTSDRGSVFYNSTLWVNRIAATYDMPVPVLDFSCVYDTDYVVSTNLQPVVDNQTSYRSDTVHGELSIQLCKSSVCQNECPAYKSLQDGATYAVNENIHLDLTMSANVSVSFSFETEVIEAFLSCSRDRNYPSKAYLIQGCNTSEMLNVNVGHRDSASMCVSFKVPKMKGCSKAYLHVKVSWCLKSWLRMEVCDSGRNYRRCGNKVQKRSVSNGNNDVVYHVFGPLYFTSSSKEFAFQSDKGPVVVLPDEEPKIAASPATLPNHVKGFNLLLVIVFGSLLVLVSVILVLVMWCMGRTTFLRSKLTL